MFKSLNEFRLNANFNLKNIIKIYFHTKNGKTRLHFQNGLLNTAVKMYQENISTFIQIFIIYVN